MDTRLSTPGIGSNLDVNGIVSQLMAIERRPLTLLEQSQQTLQSRISAMGTLKSSLASLRSAASALASDNTLGALKASSSNTDALAASAGASAQRGTYQIEILQLADSHRVASGAFASASSPVGTGTLTFEFGTIDAGTGAFSANAARPSQTVTISAADQSPAGVRDAINRADIGVRASLINDGTGYRLVLSSQDSGAANALRISVTDDDGNHVDATGLSRFAFDASAGIGAGRNMTQLAAGRDAQFKVDGLLVTSASNRVSQTLQGVTLDLQKADPGEPITLTIDGDKTRLKDAVKKFVDGYNAASTSIRALTAYDASTNRAGALQGDSAVLGAASKLRGAMSGVLDVDGTTVTTLADTGISFDRDGKLVFSEAKLDAALANRPDAVARLFGVAGRSAAGGVSLLSTSTPGSAGTYNVAVTAAPTSGQLAGDAVAGLTIATGVNDRISLVIDGVSTSVTLQSGTYASAAALASDLEQRLNANPAMREVGNGVRVTESGAVLSVRSTSVGAGSTVTLGSANGNALLFGAAPTSTPGSDIRGTIEGVAASGAGDVLSGAQGSSAQGIAVRVANAMPGSSFSLDVTLGAASKLANAIDALLGSEGAIAKREESFNRRVRDLTSQRERMNDRLDAVELRLRQQFTRLDTLVSGLTQTSSFLTQQISRLPK